MTVQEEMEAITAAARSYRWTPELFERVRAILPYADAFNILRRELLPVEYDQLDLEYCSYYRPQDRELTKALREERKEEEWKKRKAHLLRKKKRLLLQK